MAGTDRRERGRHTQGSHLKMGDWFCEEQVQMVTGSYGRVGSEQYYDLEIHSSSLLREQTLRWALGH